MLYGLPACSLLSKYSRQQHLLAGHRQATWHTLVSLHNHGLVSAIGLLSLPNAYSIILPHHHIDPRLGYSLGQQPQFNRLETPTFRCQLSRPLYLPCLVRRNTGVIAVAVLPTSDMRTPVLHPHPKLELRHTLGLQTRCGFFPQYLEKSSQFSSLKLKVDKHSISQRL